MILMNQGIKNNLVAAQISGVAEKSTQMLIMEILFLSGRPSKRMNTTYIQGRSQTYRPM